MNEVIAAARACLGTPFHHQGRTPGAGLDCIGLVVVGLRAIGVDVQDRTDYGRQPDSAVLLAALTEHGMQRVDDVQVGDVLLFRFRGEPQHVALATDVDRMIHAYAPAGAVVETTMGAAWRRRLWGVYRFVV